MQRDAWLVEGPFYPAPGRVVPAGSDWIPIPLRSRPSSAHILASQMSKQGLSIPGEVIRCCRRDRLNAESASIAYYFFLSFFPMILTLFSLTGLLGRRAAFEWVMEELLVALPPAAAETIGRFVLQVTNSRSPSALSIGILLTIWTASNVFAALADSLNNAYEAKRAHRWWKKRALSLAMLLLLAAALVAQAAFLLAGPEVARILRIEPFDSKLRWPITLALSVLMMWFIYFTLPNHDQSRSKRWILAGAVTGTSLWALATIGFRLFLVNTGRFSAVYGVVGGMVALLIWLYLTAMSILIGGEVAAVLERRLGKKDARSRDSGPKPQVPDREILQEISRHAER
jgi:membrane protein